MKRRIICLFLVTVLSAALVTACKKEQEKVDMPQSVFEEVFMPAEEAPVSEPTEEFTKAPMEEPIEAPIEAPVEAPPAPELPLWENPEEEPLKELPVPEKERVCYLLVAASELNLRTGAGRSYTSLGKAEKNTLYACEGEENGWYRTYFRGRTAYMSAAYLKTHSFERGSEEVERVISEGAKLLGTKYVYGATRYLSAEGKRLSGFSAAQFDCSSLMQYIFYLGAGVRLGVTTRTQVKQGTAVEREQLVRGDLLFFTNSSRVNKTGIEKVGHVALYLGENYILHTASDYAKIEEISPARWQYFLCARRLL